MSGESQSEVGGPADAARAILRDRLWAVESLVRRCRKECPPSPEAVHLLRGATRRADAAVAALSSGIDWCARKKIQKRLRRIRRTAGGVRDLDVALEILRELSPRADALPGLVQTIEDAERLRNTHALEFQRTVTRRAERKFRKWRRLMTRALNGSPAIDVPGLALQAVLAAIAFTRAAAAQHLPDIRHLHSLRIELRSLRHTLEVFDTFLPASTPYAGALREATDVLGRVHDLARVAVLCAELRPGAVVAIPPTGRALPASFALIRDRRHAHAIQFVSRLEDTLLTPLETALTGGMPPFQISDPRSADAETPRSVTA